MARSTYIYILHSAWYAGPVLATFTVKHELVTHVQRYYGKSTADKWVATHKDGHAGAPVKVVRLEEFLK